MGGIGVLFTFILGAFCNWWQLAAAMMVSIPLLFYNHAKISISFININIAALIDVNILIQ